MNDYSWLADAAERVLWTLVQVAIAAAVVATADLDGIWVVPLTTFLTALKTQVAKHVGSEPDAALLFTSRKPPA